MSPAPDHPPPGADLFPGEEPAAGAGADDERTLAAVDLGSNSFHMVVARVTNGRPQVLDKLKEMVRLAAGLREDNSLDPAVADNALACLARFGQRLRHIPQEQVRAVGTNTLRRARDGGRFLARAEEALGHPVEIISGREEARLVYQGVCHSHEQAAARRLVVDIGGGSTEVVVGEDFQPELLESLYMGCVSFSQRFFADGTISKAAMKAAELAARQELESIQTTYRNAGWDTAIGASGTILAIQAVVAELGHPAAAITPEALRALRSHLVSAGHVDALGELTGLPEKRRAVFPGGVAILSALFRDLRIDAMQVSQGALREGLLYDMLGRRTRQDIRDTTAATVARRYSIDLAHATRVQDTATYLLVEVADTWGLDVHEAAPILRWAALLHEIGLDVAHSQFHKHGAYLLTHMDMPGFSRNDQQRLALLVRCHRRKWPAEEFAAALPDGDIDEAQLVTLLAVLLRLAVVLHRMRTDEAMPLMQVTADSKGLDLRFPAQWFDEHPLTRLDLEQEASWLKAPGIRLTFG